MNKKKLLLVSLLAILLYGFESSKLSEDEIKEYESTRDWEEYKKTKNLHEETVNARNRAKKRFSNN